MYNCMVINFGLVVILVVGHVAFLVKVQRW